MSDEQTQRIAELERELAAMRPVVEAAERLTNTFRDKHQHPGALYVDAYWLAERVDAYRKHKEARQEKNIILKQLNLAEAALEAIRREVRPHSEDKHQLMAAGYVDQIYRLRAELTKRLQEARQ